MDSTLSTVTATAPAPVFRIEIDPSMLVGVQSIDREHYALLAQLNRLIENPLAEPASEPFADVLGHLGPQISAHFDSEEEVLRSIGMPAHELAEHFEAHTEILEQYAQMNCDLMEGKVLARADALRAVKSWIIDHLHRYDSKIRNYVRVAP